MPETLFSTQQDGVDVTVTRFDDGSISTFMKGPPPKTEPEPEPEPEPDVRTVFELPAESNRVWPDVNRRLLSGPATIKLQPGVRHSRLDVYRKIESAYLLTIQGPGVIDTIRSQNSQGRDVSNVTIENLTVECPDGKIISISGSNWTIWKVKAFHMAGATDGPGIYVVPTASAPEGSSEPAPRLRNIVITQCEIGPTHGEAIYIGGAAQEGNGEPHANIIVSHNVIVAPGEFGGQPDAIDVKVVDEIIVTDNRIEGMDGKGQGRAIVTQGCKGLKIEHNAIHNCDNCEDGWIAVNNTWRTAEWVRITGNSILGCTGIRRGAVVIYAANRPVAFHENEFRGNDGPNLYAAPGVVIEGQEQPPPPPPPPPPTGDTVELARAEDLPGLAAQMKPGQTIVVPNGMVLPKTVLYDVAGEEGKPITIRSATYLGAQFRTNGEPHDTRQPGPVLSLGASCSHVVVEGFEVSSTVSDMDRILKDHYFGQAPPGTVSPLPVAAIGNYGRHNTIIGCYLHDCLSGYGQFGRAPYGNRVAHCIIMNNGGLDPNGDSGHGLYIQNNRSYEPTVIEGNAVLGNFDLALQFYGSSQSGLDGLRLLSNAFYRNGVVIGSTGQPVTNINVADNLFYNCSFRLGYTWGRREGQAENSVGIVSDNHFIAGTIGSAAPTGPLVNILYWDNLSVNRNVMRRVSDRPCLRLFARRGASEFRNIAFRDNRLTEPIVKVIHEGSTQFGERIDLGALEQLAPDKSRGNAIPDHAQFSRESSTNGWTTVISTAGGIGSGSAWNPFATTVMRQLPLIDQELVPDAVDWYDETPFHASIRKVS